MRTTFVAELRGGDRRQPV